MTAASIPKTRSRRREMDTMGLQRYEGRWNGTFVISVHVTALDEGFERTLSPDSSDSVVNNPLPGDSEMVRLNGYVR